MDLHRRYSDYWTDGWLHSVAKQTLPLSVTETSRKTVKVGMFFYSLKNVDEVQGTIDISFWLRMSWYDPNLWYNVTEHGGVTQSVVDPKLVWTPNILLYNSVDDYMGSNLKETKPWVYQSNDTSAPLVYWSRPGTAQVRCRSEDVITTSKEQQQRMTQDAVLQTARGEYPPRETPLKSRPQDPEIAKKIGKHWPASMDLSLFPFDTQFCEVVWGGWTDSGLRVDFELLDPAVEPSPDQGGDVGSPSPEFSVGPIYAEKIEKFYNCCPDEPWPLVHFYLSIKRHTVDYVQNIIIPVIFLTYIGFLSFIIPTSSGERVSLGVTCLLTILAVMYITTNDTPRTNRITALSIFYNGSLAFVILPVCVSCAAAYFVDKQTGVDKVDDMIQETLDLLNFASADEFAGISRRHRSRRSIRNDDEGESGGLFGNLKKMINSPRNIEGDGAGTGTSPREKDMRNSTSFRRRRGFVQRMPCLRAYRLRHLFVWKIKNDLKDVLNSIDSRIGDKLITNTGNTKDLGDHLNVNVWPTPFELTQIIDASFLFSLSIGYTAFLIILEQVVVGSIPAKHLVESVLIFILVFVAFAGISLGASFLYHIEVKLEEERLYSRDGLPGELDERQIKAYRTLFRAFDRDRNGDVTAAELIAVYGDQGRMIDESVLRERLGRIDANKDETISFAEFVVILERERTCARMRSELKGLEQVSAHSYNRSHSQKHQGADTAVHHWTAHQVSQWLNSEGFSNIALHFVRHGVTGQILLSLTTDELKNDLGVTKLADRRNLMKKIGKLHEISVMQRFRRVVDAMNLTRLNKKFRNEDEESNITEEDLIEKIGRNNDDEAGSPSSSGGEADLSVPLTKMTTHEVA